MVAMRDWRKHSKNIKQVDVPEEFCCAGLELELNAIAASDFCLQKRY